MKIFRIFYSVSLITLIFSGCVAYENSYKIDGEKLVMKVKEDSSLLTKKMPPQEIASRGLATDIIGKAGSIAFTSIKNLIDNDSKKYNAEYHSGLNNLYFYKKPSSRGPNDPEGMQFKGYEFLRTFDNNGKVDTALYMAVSIDMSNKYDIVNNSIFRLKLDKFVFNYSKAKINGSRWYYPWTYIFSNAKENKINMDVKITISGTWINEQQQIFKNEELGVFYLTLRNMPIDKSTPGYKEYYDKIKGTILNGLCFLPPRSFGYYYDEEQNLTKCWGQGIYSILVTCTESSKENFYATTLRSSSGDILDELQDKVITPDNSQNKTTKPDNSQNKTTKKK